MDIDQINQILYYTDTVTKAIYSIILADITIVNIAIAGPVVPEIFAIEINTG
jgi:sugar lactone lactonase YvrE